MGYWNTNKTAAFAVLYLVLLISVWKPWFGDFNWTIKIGATIGAAPIIFGLLWIRD